MSENLTEEYLTNFFRNYISLLKEDLPSTFEKFRLLFYTATEDWWMVKEEMQQSLPKALYTKLDQLFNMADDHFESAVLSQKSYDPTEPSFKEGWRKIQQLANEVQKISSY